LEILHTCPARAENVEIMMVVGFEVAVERLMIILYVGVVHYKA
jgi:hypothetical protein